MLSAELERATVWAAAGEGWPWAIREVRRQMAPMTAHCPHLGKAGGAQPRGLGKLDWLEELRYRRWHRPQQDVRWRRRFEKSLLVAS